MSENQQRQHKYARAYKEYAKGKRRYNSEGNMIYYRKTDKVRSDALYQRTRPEAAGDAAAELG